MADLATFSQPFKRLFGKKKLKPIAFTDLFARFQNILHENNTVMKIMADMSTKAGGDFVFDKKYLVDCILEIGKSVQRSAYHLNFITANRYLEVFEVIEKLVKDLEVELSTKTPAYQMQRLYYLDQVEEGMEEAVGYKTFNLARMINLPDANVPCGFVVSVAGFRDYLAYNNLFEGIDALMKRLEDGTDSVENVSRSIRLMILGGEIPPYLRQEILSAAKQIGGPKAEEMLYSVRSSAVGEDGDWSFAGLYDSFLNVPFGELLAGYKKVMASLYSQSSLEYRIRKNLSHMEMAISVLYQKMAAGRVSGVFYSLDPNWPERPESVLSAGWGLGKLVVEGEGPVDSFRVQRDPPHFVTEQRIVRKDRMIASTGQGVIEEVPAAMQEDPCLNPDEIRQIAEVGLMLERFFKIPLDVEWSLDREGKLWILQARRLHIEAAKQSTHESLQEIVGRQRVLLAERGMIAYRGVGTGPITLVETHEDLNRFPSGGVLVSHYAHPWLAKAIPKASAIVTDIGTVAGHMATVAREFRVPAIVGAEGATQVLTENMEVTVDAERNRVYEGCVDELVKHQLIKKPTFEITSEFQQLRRLLKKITPLYLVDPDGADFDARGCKTIHDLVRFIHQKAFQALTRPGESPRQLFKQGAKQLKSNVPLDLVVIDIGGGLAKDGEENSYVFPRQFTSFPMQAFWRGLSSPQTWDTEPVSVDFKSLMASLIRTQTAEVTGGRAPMINLAVIGANYLNLSLPLGYHYTAVDAAVGPSPRNNYIFFRFVGGVTDMTRRSRRAVLLSSVLEQADFKVEVNGDLVIARLTDLEKDQIGERLFLIGKLIGFARQLDVLLKADADIDFYAKKFADQMTAVKASGSVS